MSDHACPVDWLFGDLSPATLARMRREFRADFEAAMHRKPGAPHKDRSALLALLPTEGWISAAELARQTGLHHTTVRRALQRARARGAPIESRPKIGGYRLRAPEEGAA